jgi:hypothetical protein
MANFQTHIATSTVLGVAYGAGGYLAFDISLPNSMVAAGLCSVAGMLPDLDSGSSVPQREMLCFVSVVVPMLALERFETIEISHEYMVFIAGLLYVFIRFVIGGIFRRFTKHRGMWHSIPAALIAGLATFLVCGCPELEVRVFKAWAVVIGFISHLALDEIYSVDWQGRKIRVKSSFGTALKWYGRSWWGNFSTYAKLAFLIVLVLGDVSLMEYLDRQPLGISQSASDWIRETLGKGDSTIHR